MLLTASSSFLSGLPILSRMAVAKTTSFLLDWVLLLLSYFDSTGPARGGGDNLYIFVQCGT